MWSILQWFWRWVARKSVRLSNTCTLGTLLTRLAENQWKPWWIRFWESKHTHWWIRFTLEQLKPCLSSHLGMPNNTKTDEFLEKFRRGKRVIFNPKIYIADFGNFKQGFLIMKLIQNSNFRVQGMFFLTIVSRKIKTWNTLKKALLDPYTIWPLYLLAHMQPYKKNLHHHFPKMRGVEGRLEFFRNFIRFGAAILPLPLHLISGLKNVKFIIWWTLTAIQNDHPAFDTYLGHVSSAWQFTFLFPLRRPGWKCRMTSVIFIISYMEENQRFSQFCRIWPIWEGKKYSTDKSIWHCKVKAFGWSHLEPIRGVKWGDA